MSYSLSSAFCLFASARRRRALAGAADSIFAIQLRIALAEDEVVLPRQELKRLH